MLDSLSTVLAAGSGSPTWGVLIAPGLVALLVAPGAIARLFFGWGDNDAR